jgi:stress response protein SCP2
MSDEDPEFDMEDLDAPKPSLTDSKKFDMEQNDILEVPPEFYELQVGLGWTDTVDANLDLDGSVVMVDDKKNRVNVVYYGNKTENGIQQMGDNKTGQGDGDDEVIKINLREVDAKIRELYITVNVYSGGSFADLHDSSVRLLSSSGTELARYALGSNLTSLGVIFGKLARNTQGWVFKAIGEQVGGCNAGAIQCSHWRNTTPLSHSDRARTRGANEWECGACTFVNSGGTHCTVCGTGKP